MSTRWILVAVAAGVLAFLAAAGVSHSIKDSVDTPETKTGTVAVIPSPGSEVKVVGPALGGRLPALARPPKATRTPSGTTGGGTTGTTGGTATTGTTGTTG